MQHHPDREALRQARLSGREAVAEAREAAREQVRRARETVRDTARAARESERALREGVPPAEDTRTRIQRVALELFTDHGYEATSLREIAERLGVTKAALYYHFKTKDEILASVVEDRAVRIGELIDWAHTQPRGIELRRELLRRYADLLHEQGHHTLMRFFERNQSSMGQHKAGEVMRGRIIGLLDLLTDPDAPLTDQVRSSLAIFALHSTWFVLRDPEITDEQRQAAALEVALDLVGPPPN